MFGKRNKDKKEKKEPAATDETNKKDVEAQEQQKLAEEEKQKQAALDKEAQDGEERRRAAEEADAARAKAEADAAQAKEVALKAEEERQVRDDERKRQEARQNSKATRDQEEIRKQHAAEAEKQRRADEEMDRRTREQEEAERRLRSAGEVERRRLRNLAAPVPHGVQMSSMEMARGLDMRLAFKMLDPDRSGRLDWRRARDFCRCAGWVVCDEEIDELLCTTLNLDRDETDKMFGLEELCDALADARENGFNSTHALLLESLQRLTAQEAQMQRIQFEDICCEHADISHIDVHSVLQTIGFQDESLLNCDGLSKRLLEHVCSPELDRTRVEDPRSMLHKSARVY